MDPGAPCSELPALSWREGGSLCWASPSSAGPYQLPPSSLCILGELAQLRVPPLGDPRVHPCPPPASAHTMKLALPVPSLLYTPSPSAPSQPCPSVHLTLHPPCRVPKNDTVQPLHAPLHAPVYLGCPLGAPAPAVTPCPSPHTAHVWDPSVCPSAPPAPRPSPLVPAHSGGTGGLHHAAPAALSCGCPRGGACPRRTNTGWEYWV